jgi:hypothetical protein
MKVIDVIKEWLRVSFLTFSFPPSFNFLFFLFLSFSFFLLGGWVVGGSLVEEHERA